MVSKKSKLIFSVAVMFTVLLIVGVSYALFASEFVGTRNQNMVVGSVNLNFSGQNALVLSDKTVVSDDVGSAMSESDAYVFDVVSTVNGTINVKYDLALDSISGTGVNASNVKINLERKQTVDGNTTSEFVLGTSSTGVLISSLESTVSSNHFFSGYVIDSGTFTQSGTYSYVLRAWINNLDASNQINNSIGVCSDTTYTTQNACETAGYVWGDSHTGGEITNGTFSFKVKLNGQQV